MASRNRELEESIESVTCAICMEVFSDGRILVCNHTYCLGCLVSYQHLNDSTTKECPKCRRSTVPRLSEIPSLPPNVFANKVAELIRSHTSDEPVPDGGNDNSDDFITGELVDDEEAPNQRSSASSSGRSLGWSVMAGLAVSAISGGIGGAVMGVAVGSLSYLAALGYGKTQAELNKQKYRCDSCYQEKYFVRYKCGVCSSFVVCSHCFTNRGSRLHDVNHLFLKLNARPLRRVSVTSVMKQTAMQMVESLDFSSRVHHKAFVHTPEKLIRIPGIKCRSCGTMPLTGIRYKCGHCNDYDLCEKCEPFSHRIHNKKHVFLVVKYYAEVNVTSTPLLRVAFY